ncbi:protein-L-isoaspartate O-methyltransferase [Candidatus Parcubacteria bacterium]|nr:protein-L-isoaspartate O-methyltransferase [Patescibacteria group bacterium]MBU4466731.1 protein-L-isoaspartate O-methyltransferase [Patescibacteria group bacterium]MCG2688452.1 protein-L-isoaspartate O-methyltransferase [Candidatus Parcubacteria bacterium]
MNLIDSLIAENWLKTSSIINAFRKVKRADFLPSFAKAMEGEPDDLNQLAELNEALLIGHNQTISQPLVVAFMLELLNPEPGHKVLDIGSGSGWTSALLGNIVGDKGRVIAIEVIPSLKELGQKNASKYGNNMDFICANGVNGYPSQAPYDRILASAALNATSVSLQRQLPQAWKDQLKTDGIIVTPIQNSIWMFKKLASGKFEEKEYPGFVFVPFIEK